MDDRKAPLGARGEEDVEGVEGGGLNAEITGERGVPRGESKTRADPSLALAATLLAQWSWEAPDLPMSALRRKLFSAT